VEAIVHYLGSCYCSCSALSYRCSCICSALYDSSCYSR